MTALPGKLEVASTQVYTFKTPDEARALAGELASLCPDPERSRIGLMELLLNAVEHGNLAISYAQKTELVETFAFQSELERRLQLPEHGEKRATVSVTRTGGELQFLIQDQGDGFDWSPYLEIDPTRVLHPHGRGIAWAKAVSFDRLEYRGRGNEVLAVIAIAAG